MGFFFRRSVGIGPFRINLSKRGVGVSVGVRGFRTGISSTGRRSTRLSIPGTGIGYQVEHGKGDSPRESAPGHERFESRTPATSRSFLPFLLFAGLIGFIVWIATTSP
jgi:hypothetical protein